MIAATNAATHVGSINVRRLGDGVVVAGATFSDSGSYTGTSSYLGSDSWYNEGSSTYNYTGTALGGTVYNVNKTPPGGAGTSDAPAYGQIEFIEVYPSASTSLAFISIGSTTYTANPGTVGLRQTGTLGLWSHAINLDPIETFVAAARHSQSAAIPGSATEAVIVSAHPRTGEIIHKFVPLSASPAPSYGWA